MGWILNKNRRMSQGAARGFTLIELLVVVFIILVLVLLTVPAVKALNKNNGQRQAVNLLTTMIAQGRALAMERHQMAGIILFEYSADATLAPGTNYQTGQTYVQLFYAASYGSGSASVGTVTLSPFPGADPQALPPDIVAVATDDGANLVRFSDVTPGAVQGFAATQRARIILFDENGQLVLRSSLSGTFNFSANALANAASSPGLVVFNLNDMRTAKDNGVIDPTVDSGNKSLGNWFEQNADVLTVNRVTGAIIR